MKELYQRPEVEIICYSSEYIMQEASPGAITPGNTDSNESKTFDENELGTTNSSLWDD